MNEMIQCQLNHRSIRYFKEEAVDDALNHQIYKVMNQTATSTGVQSYSVIRVTDDALKQAISEISRQSYVAKMPELLIFVVDCYRNAQITKEQGFEPSTVANMDRFFQGVADAYLAAQNVTNAIESLGLGAVFLGSILNDSEKMIELLKLPQLTFPIVGVGYGIPDESPELKPRMPLAFKLGENGYPFVEDYQTALADYDDAMTKYYDTRTRNKRSDTFTTQVVTQVHRNLPKRAALLKVIQKQGFDLGVESLD